MCGKNLNSFHSTRQCKHCKNEFEGYKSASICPTCKPKSFCNICGKESKIWGGLYYGKKACLECLIIKSKELYTEENKSEWIECKICGYKAKELSSHLIHVHGIQPKEYGVTKSQSKIDRMKGENNPGYQHGGLFSPWSEKSKTHDITLAKERHKSAIEKSLLNPNSGIHSTRIEYYLAQGLSQEEAMLALSKRQSTFSLKKCIDKYGEVDGFKRWQGRQEKWQLTLNSKSDEELAEINAKKIWKNGIISKTEKELYDCIKESIPGLMTQLRLKNGNTRWYFYDMYLDNKIIEFNGDYWHANPSTINIETYKGVRNSTAQEIWDKDSQKIKHAENAGYDVLIIWESDFKKNKQETIQKCLTFLTQ